MLRRLLPFVGAAGATALFAIMGIAPASAQRYDDHNYNRSHSQNWQRNRRNYDRDDRWNNYPRWDQDRNYNRDRDDHPRWQRNRRHNDGDHDRDDRRNRRHRHYDGD